MPMYTVENNTLKVNLNLNNLSTELVLGTFRTMIMCIQNEVLNNLTLNYTQLDRGTLLEELRRVTLDLKSRMEDY